MTSCTNQLDSSTAKKADDQPFPFFSYIVRPDSVLSISVPRVEEIFLIRRNLMKMSLISTLYSVIIRQFKRIPEHLSLPKYYIEEI